MIYPNTSVIDFCDWLINSGYKKFSVPRLYFVNKIKEAAQLSISVTVHEYNTFVMITNAFIAPYDLYNRFKM